jgi:hypothetical protein
MLKICWINDMVASALKNKTFVKYLESTLCYEIIQFLDIMRPCLDQHKYTKLSSGVLLIKSTCLAVLVRSIERTFRMLVLNRDDWINPIVLSQSMPVNRWNVSYVSAFVEGLNSLLRTRMLESKIDFVIKKPKRVWFSSRTI